MKIPLLDKFRGGRRRGEALKIPLVDKFRGGKKKKDSRRRRRGEELNIPPVDKFGSREWKNRIADYCAYLGFAVLVVGVYVGTIWGVLAAGYEDDHPIQPELQLNSILVCPTIRESVIWDLKFDLINTYNDTYVCVFRFEVYIFLYNQSKSNLLAKAYAIPVSPGECIYPGNRSSIIAFAEEDLSDHHHHHLTNETIRLDLKLHNHDYDLVCGDAKVSLSSMYNSLSSCGSMEGDPLVCSYEPRSPHTLVTLLLLIFLLLLITSFFGSCCWVANQ